MNLIKSIKKIYFSKERSIGLWEEGNRSLLLLLERSRDSDRVIQIEEVKRLDKGPSFKRNGEEIWVGGLSAVAVLIRPISIPLKRWADCERALPFQAESRLPFPIEEAVVAPLFIKSDKSSTDLLFYATRKRDVEELLNRWSELKIEPDRIAPMGLALAAIVARLVDPEGRRALFYCSNEGVVVALVESGRLLGARHVAWGGSIVHALLSLPSFREGVVGELLLCGPKIKKVDQAQLKQEVGMELRDLDLSHFIGVKGEEWLIPLGLALVGLEKEKRSVNFRRGEFALPHPLRRFRRKLTTFASLSLALALSLALLGRTFLIREEAELKSRYLKLAALSKAEALTPLPKGVDPLIQAARKLERESERGVDLFPLEPILPRVSEVANWLSSHSQLIQLDSLRYLLVQYPHVKRSDARYQLRLELEFRAESSTAAREFHAALIEPNPWVDPSGEVQWGTTPQGYRTSFLLRDRTYYPQARR